MRITGSTVTRVCAVCERTLLMGERATRYSADGLGGDYVDVCPLCQEIAADQGWVKEGTPTAPRMATRTRRRRPSLVRLLAPKRPQTTPVVSEPILRRLSESELAVVESADLFNESDHCRSVAGIAKSLGSPRASIFRLPGVNEELVLTVAWDISWYQYRISPDSPQPVRLAERGYDLGELDARFTRWNARIEPDGRLVPNIERL